jgi:hypothetical protein
MKTTGSFVWIFEILTMSLGFSGGRASVVVVSGAKDVVGEDVSEGLELFALAPELTLNWKKRQLTIIQGSDLRIFINCEAYGHALPPPPPVFRAYKIIETSVDSTSPCTF